MEIQRSPEEAHRCAVVESLKAEFPNSSIIVINTNNDGTLNATWTGNLHPLQVAGILEAMADSIRQKRTRQI